MKCECGAKSMCIDTRDVGNQTVKRRHLCSRCGARFNKFEKPDIADGRHRKSPLTIAESEMLQRLLDKLMVIATTPAKDTK